MNQTKCIRLFRTASAILLFLSVFVTISFGLDFLYTLIPEANDGIAAPGMLMQLFYGDNGWTRVRYFEAFRSAVYVSFGLLLVYTAAFVYGRKRGVK